MKIRKGVIALVAIFVTAGISQFAYACDGTTGNSEQKTMNAYGREGFKKAGDQQFSGRGNEDGKHQGGHKGRHEGKNAGEHQGKHRGGNKQKGSGNQEQPNGGQQQTEQPSGTNSNQNIDFSSYTDSASLDAKAWEALNAKDYATAQAFAQEAINRYSSQAKEQQASLSDFAPEGGESQYWALNDVATALFILGSTYKAQGDTAKAKEQFNIILSQYKYAQAYDPAQDIYWKVAEAAQKELDSL
jgi:hypothetical protein